MEKVTIKYKFPEVLEANQLHWNRQLSYKIARLITFFGCIFFGIVILASKTDFLAWFLFLLSLSYWTGIFLAVQVWINFKRHPFFRHELYIEFHSDRVFVRSFLGESSVNWFEKVIINRRMILLIHSWASIVFLPKAHTQDDEQFSRIAELVQQIPQGKDQIPHVNQ